MEEKREDFLCPNCHGRVPFDALVCPHCGSDDHTGWSSQTLYDGLDLPDSNERLPGFRDTLLWKDLKFLLGLLLLLSVFGAYALIW